MVLFRIHAYEITPQRLAGSVTPPRGGAFAADAAFRSALDEFLVKSKLETQPSVDFHRDHQGGAGHRTHTVRQFILNYCFGSAPTAKSAAVSLGTKLGQSMDDRSPFTLLLLAAYKDGATRRLVIWAFPKDEPFHFSVSGERARIRILNDAFSRSSSFRKAALFEGTHSPTTFWTGRVIDKQAQHGFGTAADYWVSTFLESRYSLTGKAGTRLLAKCLRATYDALAQQDDRDQISNAIVAIHVSRRRQWSLRSFATEYLDGNAKQTFLSKSPADSRTTTFNFQKTEFEQKLNFRVFRLEDNVMVSAPFGTVGKSVTLQDGEQRTLRCEGTVVDEKVRAKYA